MKIWLSALPLWIWAHRLSSGCLCLLISVLPITHQSVTAATLAAGDLAPQGLPDGQLNAADLLIMEQIVLGTRTPTADEMLVADVAPLGAANGQLDAGDLVVLSRAVLGDIVLPPSQTEFIDQERVEAAVNLDVSSGPSSAANILGTQPAGATGTVTSGPVFADGLWWWNIDYDNGADGWSLEAELATSTIPSQNLVAHWSFDEGTGGAAFDSSGNGYHGTLVNGPVWGAGRIGGALDLNGVNDYVDAGSPAALDDLGVKTIAAWINRKDIINSQYIALKGYTGGQGGWEFYARRSTGGVSANRLGYNHEWSASTSGTAIWYGSTDLGTTTAWYHVAVVYDSTSSTNTPDMYVNGIKQMVFVEQGALGSEGSDAANNLTLGGVPGESGDMVLDDAYIYDRALSAAEILQLYYRGAPAYQCSDNLDNDSDGLIDFPVDTGCSSHTDNDESGNPQPNPFTILANWASYDPGANGVGISPDGYMGGAFDGRYVYFSPDFSKSEVMRYDTTAPFSSTSSWSAFDPNPPSGGGYKGAVFDGRYIYFVPYYANSTSHGEVLRYDTTLPYTSSASWTTFDPGSQGTGTDPDGYWGALYDGRYIYFAPEWDSTSANPAGGEHGEVLRYDTTGPFTTSSSWSTYDPGTDGIGNDPDGYKGIMSDGRYLYFVPYYNDVGSHGEFLRYDTTLTFNSANAWRAYTPGANGIGNVGKGYESAVTDGRYIYFVPSYSGSTPADYHGEVMRYDTLSPFDLALSWAAFDPGANGVGIDPDGYNGATFDGRYIYFAPTNNGTAPHGEVLRYDTMQNFASSVAWTTFDPGFYGLGNDPDGYAETLYDGRYIYFVPDRNGTGIHGEVLRYDTGP